MSTETDSLTDFERRRLTFLGRRKLCFVSGSGPAVIVLHELPGISRQAANLARRIRDTGFTVYMPSLVGVPGAPLSVAGALRESAKICINREFRLLAAHRSSPVVDWLRALAAHVHPLCGGRGVGALGMCLTGNFALGMMVEPAVVAPVLCEPSLPLMRAGGLHATPADVATVRARLENEDLTMLAYRFEGDRLCRKARFDALKAAFGDRVLLRTLPDSAANPEGFGAPHSVLTLHLIDREGEPTREALDEVLAFLKERLLPSVDRGNSLEEETSGGAREPRA